MRKQIEVFALLFALFTVFCINAQITVVNDGILTIKEGQLVHINGNFSNYSSQLSNRGDIGLTGNLLNEVRVMNPGIGIFRFIGFQKQTVSLFDTLDMFNVKIDNPTGLTFDGITHLGVFGNMNFWDGVINTNSESMLFFQNNASASNGSFYSYIDGPALKSGINDFVFPLGKEGDYRPAAISDLTSFSTFQMEYFHYPYFWYWQEFEVLKVNEEGFWDFQKINGLSNPKLTLTYDETTNMFTDNSDLEIVYWDEDLWKIVPSDSVDASPFIGLTTQDQVVDYGYFKTAQSRELIPEASFFIAEQNDCEIRVDWAMPPGTLVANYEIEYSYDSLDFTYVGEVPGDTAMLNNYRNYQFIDQNLHEVSKVYYRIKLIATGPWGAFTYSPVISVFNKCIFEDCVLYPNPVSSDKNLQFQVTSNIEAKMWLEIWNALGRLEFKQTLELMPGQHIYEIKTKEYELVSGTYFIYVNPRKSLKFVVIGN